MEETWTPTTNPSVMARVAAPSIAASKRLDLEFQTQHWPPKALAHIKQLTTANDLEINDLDQLGHLGSETLEEWDQHFEIANRRSSSASSALRSDLGLPPASFT
jgi:hypothetical protein